MIFLFKKTFLVYLFSGGVIYGVSNINLKSFTFSNKNKSTQLDVIDQIKIKDTKNLIQPTKVINKQQVDNSKKTQYLEKIIKNLEISKLESLIIDLSSQIYIEKKQLKTLKDLSKTAHDEYSKAVNDEKTSKKDYFSLNKSIASQEKKKKFNIDLLEKENKKILDLQAQKANLEFQLSGFKVSKISTNEKKTKKDNELKNKSGDLKDKKEKINIKITEIKAIESDLLSKNNDLQQCKDVLKEIKTKLSTSISNRSESEQKIMEFNNDISSTSDSDERDSKEVEKASEEAKKIIYKKEVGNFNSQKTQNTKNIETLKDSIDEKTKSLVEKKQSKKNLVSERDALLSEITKLNQEVSVLKNNLDELKRLIKKITNKNSKVSIKLTTSQTEKTTYESKIASLETEITEKEKELIGKLVNHKSKELIKEEKEKVKADSEKNYSEKKVCVDDLTTKLTSKKEKLTKLNP